MKGLVVRNTGSHFVVKTDNGELIPCKVKGNFRLKGIRTTNPIAVGDIVTVSDLTGDVAYITQIEARRNYIIRRATNLSKEAQIIASNIDQTLLVATLFHPTTSTTFIDRFLATAEAYQVPAILVINKTDLLNDDEEKEYLEALTYLYSSIGYKVVHTSTVTGEGIDKLNELLASKTTLLSGNSGVGKSSIINRILPDLNLRTAAISEIHDTGMHTTTFSEMFNLPNGGFIIDTPGVKGFGTVDFKKEEVSHFFPEIFKISRNCKYGNCTHTHEPNCAVINALDEHFISVSRYNSYLSILEDANPNNEDKYRKPY